MNKPINEFIAMFEFGEQIANDYYTITHPTMKITENTTISEIYSWYRARVFDAPMCIRIQQLEEEQP